jgi:spermidine/putrescine transport system permease protein
MKTSRFPLIMTCIVFAFLYFPIVLLIINSFNASRFGGNWAGFSLRWYYQLFHERGIWLALINSLIIGTSATLFSTFLGTTAAFAIHRFKSRLQKVHYALILSPLIIPEILMGISLLFLFVALNVQLGLLTVFIAHTTFCICYVTVLVLARLQQFDFSVIEAAQDLGASGFVVLKRILIPLLAPGIISGALLAFTISIDDYVVTSFVAGPGSTTLPIYVYGMIKFGSTPLINALSTILLTLTFAFVCTTQYLLGDTST